MKLFGNRKREKLPVEERMHYSASSFSFAIGDVFPCTNAEDARLVLKDRQGYGVVLVPGENLLTDPRPWVKALSFSSYVIIFSEGKERQLKRFLSLLDGQIFSPVPKTIAGAICVQNPQEVKDIASSMDDKNFITIIPR